MGNTGVNELRTMKDDKKPLVSIGLPVYNGEKLISQAIESLLSQDFKDFELIISDNASLDRTDELCKAYAEQDERIIYRRNSRNLGMAANYNKVASLARGTFFMWASHDDSWDPSYISCCIIPLLESPSVVLAYTKSLTIARGGESCWQEYDNICTLGIKAPWERIRKVHKGAVRRTAIYGLMRRDAVMKALPISYYRMPDHVFLVVMAIFGEFAFIPERLFTYRMQEHYVVKDGIKVHASYQMVYETEAANPKEFKTLFPASLAICRRVTHEELTLSDKRHILIDTFVWYLRMEWNRRNFSKYKDVNKWKKKLRELFTYNK